MQPIPSSPTRSGKLPRIAWHPSGRQFASRIGYKLYKRNGKEVRDRSFQLLGKDERAAMQKAIDIQADWEWTVAHFKSSFPGVKPHWLEEAAVLTYQAKEREDMETFYETGIVMNVGEHSGEPDYQTLGDFLAERRRSNVTLAQGKDLYLAHIKGRIGLGGGKGIQEYTYINYKQDLEHVLKFIDQTMLLSSLMRSDFERFVNHWMALPNGMSIRTAVNYCKTLKQMIDWLADEEAVEFNKPRGTDRLFRFKNFNPVHVEPYTNDQLKALFAALPERYRFYVQLAINCGYCQSDIATLRYEHLFTIHQGVEVPVRDLSAFAGDLYIRRRRQKTLHQNDFETLCYLWPENVSALQKLAAPANNLHGLVLLNDEGQPLRRGRTNNITERFNKYKHDANLGRDVEFKQFRKTGATWIESRFGERVARMYTAHAMNGELKRYVAQNFEPLTAALKVWATELRTAGVLTGEAEDLSYMP
jgi:integrase